MSTLKALPVIAGLMSLAVGLLIGDVTPSTGSIVTGAEARVGRPLTPMSYAGVARRTTRRAAVGVAGAAAAAGGAYYYAAPQPGCVQTVDAYGRIGYQCP
jgi:hypothetical protein